MTPTRPIMTSLDKGGAGELVGAASTRMLRPRSTRRSSANEAISRQIASAISSAEILRAEE